MKRLAIYCGSATPADPVYIESARMIGRTLAERGIGVVYGGGRLGLMGAIADTGTMDELWEALSWAQLGYHADPVGLLNVAGYYDHLIAFWEKSAQVGFLRPQHRDLLIVDDTLDGLLAKMAAHVPTQPIVRMKTSDL